MIIYSLILVFNSLYRYLLPIITLPFDFRMKYSMLVEELKEAFRENQWLLSAAVPAPKFRVESGFDVAR